MDDFIDGCRLVSFGNASERCGPSTGLDSFPLPHKKDQLLSGLIQNIQPDEDAARANGEAALWVVWYALHNSTLSVFVKELLLSVVSACIAAFVAYPVLTFSTLVVAGRVSTKDLIPILWQRILGIPRGGEAGQPRLTDILYKGFVWRVVEVLVFYGLQSAGRWLTVMMFGRGCSLLQGMTLDPKDATTTQQHTRHHSQQQHHDEEGSSSSSDDEEEDEEKERYASLPPLYSSCPSLPPPGSLTYPPSPNLPHIFLHVSISETEEDLQQKEREKQGEKAARCISLLVGPIILFMFLERLARHIASHPFEVFSVRERVGYPPLDGSILRGLFVRLAIDLPGST